MLFQHQITMCLSVRSYHQISSNSFKNRQNHNFSWINPLRHTTSQFFLEVSKPMDPIKNVMFSSLEEYNHYHPLGWSFNCHVSWIPDSPISGLRPDVLLEAADARETRQSARGLTAGRYISLCIVICNVYIYINIHQ